MSSFRSIKCIGVKAALQSETCLQDNGLDGFPSILFSTLFICLQYSDNDIRGIDVLRIFCMSIPSVKKRLLEDIDVQSFGIASCNS